MADRIGQQLGNYRLKSLLGRGGFAEVYLGEHIFLKTQAAIKVLLTQLSDEDMEDFLKESRTIANLNHPHIVRVLEFGVEENIPFLVMDLAPNGSLRQRYAKNSRLEPSMVASYVKQIAAGLQYAHEHRVIHRDIKPENLLLGKRGEVLVGDFGIALLGQSSRYQSTQNVVGTVAYMSPEQIQGKSRTASDQYSLGVVVYEWLTGERPFYGSFAELCAQHMYASPPSLRQKVPGISPVLEQVVMAALAKDPAKRFASIQTFAAVFEQASQGRELPQEIMPTWVNASVPSPSSPLLSTTFLSGQHPIIHQGSQVDPPVPALSSDLASTLPGSAAANALSSTQAAPTQVQPSIDTLTPTLAAAPIASEKLAATVIPDSIPLTFPVMPPAQRRKRMSTARFVSIVLAVAIVTVSGIALWTHLASASNDTNTAVTTGLTMTPNGVIVVPTGITGTSRVPVSSPTGHPGVLPSGTTRVFPTATTQPTPQPTLPPPSPSGTITEFPVPTSGSGSEGITKGPDGNLWFTENDANKIGRITPSGSFTEYSISSSSSSLGLFDITAGPDGNLWFVEGFANKIGRITPSGRITEYPVPTSGSQPGTITAGPDGNLWFTEGAGNKIGRITSSGSFTEYPVSTSNSGSLDITIGPDGNLWFTEGNVDKIGRITLSGSITEYQVPTSNSALEGITAGPDGNLWFVEVFTNKIGRITPSGSITEYPVPTSNSYPREIAKGPDGNLWFTEETGNKIGRITTSGSFTEYPVPNSSNNSPQDITAGSDGNLWFTDGNKIGRIIP